SVRIRITGGSNTPPSLTELTLEVPQGGERSVDLRRAVVDPDPDDDHRFSDAQLEGDGFDIDLDDGVLTASADTEVAPGTTGSVELTVSDGTEEVTGTVRLVVVGSDRPLAVVGTDTARTLQGQPVT